MDDVAELVGQDRLQFLGFELVEYSCGHADHSMLGVAAGRQGVGNRGGNHRHLGHGHVSDLAEPANDVEELRLLLRRDQVGMKTVQDQLVRVEELGHQQDRHHDHDQCD